MTSIYRNHDDTYSVIRSGRGARLMYERTFNTLEAARQHCWEKRWSISYVRDVWTLEDLWTPEEQA